MPCYCLRRTPTNKTLFTAIGLINSPLKVNVYLDSEILLWCIIQRVPEITWSVVLLDKILFNTLKKVHIACTIDVVFSLVQFAKKGICESNAKCCFNQSNHVCIYSSENVTRLHYIIRGVVYPIGHQIWSESDAFMAHRWHGPGFTWSTVILSNKHQPRVKQS
jgi:hypothetical protein